MEAPQDEELQAKIEDFASGEPDASTKHKNEESESQTLKKSKDDKTKKKDDRSVEQVLKALNALKTSEEKLAAMCKKYSDVFDENKKLNWQVKQYEKKCVALQREKDQIQSEQSKAVLIRSRLENLCRELQKQNKAIKEESLSKIQEEEEKRKVVSAKFQTALGEITSLMQQNNENFSNLKEENLEIQNKFKSLCEQYELKEQQVEKMSKQMQLESQLADVKLAKVRFDNFAEKEMLANEKEQLLVELTAYQNKCQEMQKTEIALRNQITMYTEKYDEFQSALAKSHQIYSSFKSEIEKMSKKISRLEKETSAWKMKWEGSHKALLQMATEKQQRDAELALATRQMNQLQKLCRTLQSERSSLINQLKNEGKTPKVEDTNIDTSLELSQGDIVAAESRAENEKDNSEKSLNSNLEKKDDESDCVEDLTNELIEDDSNEKKDAQKETELNQIVNHVDNETLVQNKSADESIQFDEAALIGATNKDESSKESAVKVLAEKNESKAAEKQNVALSPVPSSESGKKDQNGLKSPSANEPKKGKDGSKKKKK